MSKILIVDDEEMIRNVLVEYANHFGFDTDVAVDGLDALEKVSAGNFDCVVMDIMMPRMDGFEAVREIRKIKTLPIVLVSAKSEEYDILKGFELGADDYIVKPFSAKEVIARIKAVLKRSNSQETLQVGDVSISLSGREVYIKNQPIKLTNKEFDILVYMIKNKSKVLTRDNIINEVWGEKFNAVDRTIDAHIKMLRQDLKECGQYIKTIRGVGYKFEN